MNNPALDPASFFDSIGRPDLKTILTPATPWAYFSMEFGLPNFSFAGGLGILAGDSFLQASKINLPFIGVTLFYPIRWKQHLKDYQNRSEAGSIKPSDFNFKKEMDLNVQANNDAVHLEVYSYEINRTKIVMIYEPGLNKLYHGDASSEHRLYQEICLGFGGYTALKKMGYDPAIIHMNESPIVFTALAYLDDLCQSGASLEDALKKVKQKTLFTNHTLVPSAVACFTQDMFQKYVYKNIKTQKITDWLTDIMNKTGNILNLSLLGFEVADRINGVSVLHSQISTKEFKKINGSEVTFKPVTNGIYMQRWITRELYRHYWQTGIINEYDVPAENYIEKIELLADTFLTQIKKDAKGELINYLMERLDEHNSPIIIDHDAKIAVWAKRFAGYKRPGMIFTYPDLLAKILEQHNTHLILSGDIHSFEFETRQEIKDILNCVHSNDILIKRVHFVQDYDQTLAKYLTAGADIWLNTPEVGNEACGTSWMKAIGNLAILISTPDGGVADCDEGGYMKITGTSCKEEVESLYKNFQAAMGIVSVKNIWIEHIKKQLQVYLPLISGGRMIKDYLDLVFPKE